MENARGDLHAGKNETRTEALVVPTTMVGSLAVKFLSKRAIRLREYIFVQIIQQLEERSVRDVSLHTQSIGFIARVTRVMES